MECIMPKPVKGVATSGTMLEHGATFELVKRALACWRFQDVEQTLAVCSEDILYRLYICPSALPSGGEARGKEAVRSLLHDFLGQFGYVSYVPTVLSLTDGIARIQTRFVLRHRASAEELAGSKRFVCTFEGGQITRIVEYHDAALFTAFTTFGQWRAERQAAGAPARAEIADAYR
jgi:ketosteroid isomerase-like protein